MSDLIKREDAIEAVKKLWIKDETDTNKRQYNIALQHCISVIRNTTSTDDNWIPVKKHGMPHNEGIYIVTLRNWYGAGRCAFYDDVEILPYGREGWDKATAWMPFPEPYRESEVEE